MNRSDKELFRLQKKMTAFILVVRRVTILWAGPFYLEFGDNSRVVSFECFILIQSQKNNFFIYPLYSQLESPISTG